MKEKIIDKGHYQERAVDPDAIRVVSGEHRRLCLTPTGDLSFVLEKDAELELCLVMMPVEPMEIKLRVDFAGEGAQASLSGFYICRDAGVKLSVEVLHRVGGCTSRQLFNGIVAGSAKSAFDGRITVAPDAQGSKAFQENHNLLLSALAWADTRPQLEIYADDVECSHGATVGKLNEDELFYMRSRGIPESEARVLQMISFLAPVLASVPEEQREGLTENVEKAVRNL